MSDLIPEETRRKLDHVYSDRNYRRFGTHTVVPGAHILRLFDILKGAEGFVGGSVYLDITETEMPANKIIFDESEEA